MINCLKLASREKIIKTWWQTQDHTLEVASCRLLDMDLRQIMSKEIKRRIKKLVCLDCYPRKKKKPFQHPRQLNVNCQNSRPLWFLEVKWNLIAYILRYAVLPTILNAYFFRFPIMIRRPQNNKGRKRGLYGFTWTYMRHLRRTDVSSRRILNRALKPVGERENYFKGLDDIDAFLQDFPRMIKELCHVCAYGFQNMGGYAESEGRRRMLLITERVLGKRCGSVIYYLLKTVGKIFY